MSTPITSAPSQANAKAAARPIPLAPPVTTATLSFQLFENPILPANYAFKIRSSSPIYRCLEWRLSLYYQQVVNPKIHESLPDSI